MNTERPQYVREVFILWPYPLIIFALVNFSDSDVTIESCDGVRFLLHRKNLETHSETFPGPEFSTKGEIVRLEEPASILEILFQFMYPRKQPGLDGLGPEVLLEVAEAVQKYRVFSAMYVCGSRLRCATFLTPSGVNG